MEWQIELCKALVEMVKSGGMYALWGIAIWLLMNLLKIGLIGGIIWAIIRLVVFSVQHYLTLRLLSRKENITLLSKQCSKHIVDAIKEYQTQTGDAMKSLIVRVKELKQNSEKTNKIASPKQ